MRRRKLGWGQGIIKWILIWWNNKNWKIAWREMNQLINSVDIYIEVFIIKL